MSSVLYCSVLFFNLITICSFTRRVHSTVHEITMKLSSAGIKFFCFEKNKLQNVICNVAREFEGRGSRLLVHRSLDLSFQCPNKVGESWNPGLSSCESVV